jgi:hypothetical protein
MNKRRKYTPIEESYALDFYLQLRDSKKISKMLGGMPPCLKTGNKVFVDFHNIESMMLFHEFDGRCIRLELQMEFVKDGKKKTETVESFPCLDYKGIEGKISDNLFKQIIKDFYLPSIKYFYNLHNPKQ